MTKKRMTTQQMQELAAQSVAKPRVAEQVSPGDIKVEISTRKLRVLDVHQYDHNPRRAASEALLKIKESIRSAGLLNRITVCKLPDGRYVTAMGGGTRLEALHQLASERDEQGRPTADAVKFEHALFDEVPYVKESSLLAAHLAENLQREDMCFWDTAAGVVAIRKIITDELGKALGGRDFIEELEKRGLSKVDHANLSIYEFAVNTFQNLGMALRPHLTRNDVRDLLRPSIGLIEGLWAKHTGVGELKDLLDSWLSLYDVPPERFSAQGLLSYLHTQVARHLNYTSEDFERVLSAHKLAPQAPLAELLQTAANGPSKTGPAKASQNSPENPEDDETPEERVSREGLANLARTLKNRNSFTSGLPEQLAGLGGGDSDGADDLDLDNPLSQFNDPIPGGIKTASTHQLQIKQPFNRQEVGALLPDVFDASQAALEGLDARSGALHLMRQPLMRLADVVGLEAYVTDAPDMPYGFFVDIPPQGVLGTYAQDLAVHAWWLLANLSGQIPIDVDGFLASGLLPDTGPDGYLQCLTAVEAWQDAVINRLGGQTLLDSGFVVALLTQPSPIADLAMELTMAIKQVNEVTAEAKLPTRQGGKL